MDSNKRGLISEFQSIVREFCAIRNIQVLAEEFNEESRKINHVDHSVLESIASELSLAHCFLEPDSVERAERNIKSEDHNLREAIWLEKLSPHINSEIIVACGQTHISSFSNKLKEEGIPFEIIKENLGVGYEPNIHPFT